MADAANTIDETIKNRNESFAEYLFTLIDVKNLTDPEVYKAANVGRKTFSDIRHGKIPTKKTIIKIIFALEVSSNEACILLERAGYALSTSIDTDLIVKHFIEQKNFDKFALDEALAAKNLPKIFS